MRIDTLFAGRAVPVLIAGLIGVAAVTGWLHSGFSPKQGDSRAADTGRKPVPANSCALCGTVESIRIVELRDEVGGAGATAGGPGAAVHAELVATDRVEATRHGGSSGREFLGSLFDRADVRSALQRQGVSADEARARVNAMSDDEVEQLAARFDSFPAAGNGFESVLW